MEILSLLEPVAAAHGLEIVDAVVPSRPGRGRLEIVVDTPAGDGRVTVDQCAALSREVGHALDATDLIPGSYVLEVTSPGIDRRLGREKDFARAVGRRVALETREPLAGRRRFRGELVAFDGSRVEVATGGGSFAIPFEQIRRAQAFHPGEAPAGKR